MADYWKRSRVTKALTDAARANSFADAESRLNGVRLNIGIGHDQIQTPAGQSALLTAVATACKCFGQVTVVASVDAPLIAKLPLGLTLLKAARRLGAKIVNKWDRSVTHAIRVGNMPSSGSWSLNCWWDRWLSGTRVSDDERVGDSRLALAGVFSGAMAVRQVFAGVLAGRKLSGRDVTISLWTPWEHADPTDKGPQRFDVPDKLWLLGLGHLGQAFVWNLCFLPGQGERVAVLQDDQLINDENESTGLLVLKGDVGTRKTRLAARWFEACGWRTELIERRHSGDIVLTDADPPYLLCGLDRLKPRLILARHGFAFMLDAGVGHGPIDFEGVQLRTVVNGEPLQNLWETSETAADGGYTKQLLTLPAYLELQSQVGQCGTVGFAEASVAVPFVGAAAGALTITQAIRLATLQSVPHLLQIELGAPEMVSFGQLISAPQTNLGSFSITL